VRNHRVTAMGALLATALLGAALVGPTSSASAADGQVVVPSGSAVQIAVVLDSTSVGSPYYRGIRNAIQMAVQLQPTIDGFRIQLNDDFDAPCIGETAVSQGIADATAIVANPQNVAVIGHVCSLAFIGPGVDGACPSPSQTSALSIYQSSGVVVINGSTTSPCLSAIGPTVFNATIVSDPGSDVWYSQITALPIDRLWQLLYRIEFGAAPTAFADLYFDATRLLLTRIHETARVVHGNLVIDRRALAQAVRHTTRYRGVTCTITIDPASGFRVNDQAALARCA
jgi:hypothetical protein